VVLVRGDRVLAEPAAARLATAIGREWAIEPHTLLHPERLDDLVADLRTMALFEPGKIVVAVESGLCADRDAAATLLEQVRDALPFEGGAEDLGGAARAAARGLLQLLRLFDVDPAASPPDRALAALPAALLTSGKGKSGAEETRKQLAPLLAAALAAGLKGIGEGELSLVADLLRDGLPGRHLLILVESAAADGHPLVDALGERRAVLEAGRLSTGRRGIEGLDALVGELAAQSGARMKRDAAEELARRTLRIEEARGGVKGAVDADSASRFRAEYLKLAGLAGAEPIDRALVEDNVEDRGDEEVWSVLDEIAEGRPEGALARIRRRLAAAEDPLAEKLYLFSTLAGFARDVVRVGGAIELCAVARDVESKVTFEAKVAPRLQGKLEGVESNPLAKKKAFQLYRPYRAASRFSAMELAALPALALETELRLKGESDDPDSALAVLVLALAGLSNRAPAAAGGSRPRA